MSVCVCVYVCVCVPVAILKDANMEDMKRHTDKQKRTHTDIHTVSTAAVSLFPHTHLASVMVPGVPIESRISAPHSSMAFISLPLVLPVGEERMQRWRGVGGKEHAHAGKG